MSSALISPSGDHSPTKTKSRKSHRKSRTGCSTCKRRKVKCDETRPECNTCINFGVACGFAPQSRLSATNINPSIPPGQVDATNRPAPLPSRHRGRGRPRKNWAPTPPEEPRPIPPRRRPRRSATPGSSASPLPPPAPKTACGLNVADIELLLHFQSHTGPSLADPNSPDDPISQFWARNAPRIGLSFHAGLHLTLAVAGRHLGFIHRKEPSRRATYISLAESHAAAGLAELTDALPNIDDSNAGGIYVAALLVCYNAFAAGPSGPDDLLICNITNDTSDRCLPTVHGVRLLRQIVSDGVLFSGLTAPLGPSNDNNDGGSPPGPITATKAMFLEGGFQRLDWVEPLHSLRELVSLEADSAVAPLYLRAVDTLECVYDATYGRDDQGLYDGPPHNKLVFSWLYHMDSGFVDCLRQKEPLPLLILAYFAVLLQTLSQHWFMEGWVEHLIYRVRGLVDGKYARWLEWPLEAAGLQAEAEKDVTSP